MASKNLLAHPGSGRRVLTEAKRFHSIVSDRADVRLLGVTEGSVPLSALYERTGPEDTFWAIGLLDTADVDGS